MLLFKTAGTLHKCCMKSHITFSFYISEEKAYEMDKLMIDFSYTPKCELDESKKKSIRESTILKLHPRVKADYSDILENAIYCNLLTISVDDAIGFRGNYHKHFVKEPIFIGRLNATKGFKPGPIKEGNWKVTISNHAILTDDITYTLKIWGE